MKRKRQTFHRGRRRRPVGSEKLERRVLLDGALAAEYSSLNIDQGAYDTTSVLVRYHSDADAYAPTGIATFESIPGLHQVALPNGLDVNGSLDFYRNHPGVVYAEPNYQVSIAAIPNDPDFDSLWGLNNTGQTGGTIDADIDAPQA
ncbi:MAG: hypothetical protein KDB00_00230 [Planctomycetales bacterium]|nr:hypothetical protein [Planctomycetales bacterium]